MPNWCNNDLDITGPTEQLVSFLRSVKGPETDFDLRRIILYPEKYAALDDAAKKWDADHPGEWIDRPVDGFNSGGYEWCVRNWGTKWNAVDPYVKEIIEDPSMPGVASVNVHFRTAWSPPTPVILAASRRFPQLTLGLCYVEPLMGFRGQYRCQAGKVLEESVEDYSGERVE